jgi:thioesterase domain-containing protein
VPTLHQRILSQAKKTPESVKDLRLRFIRSSSMALPPRVMLELEDVFSVPVIESYGMTEASHQMSSNQLPPGRRKPGTIGFPAGPDIVILDEEGNKLLGEQVGEISIRGLNVTKGYMNNPDASQRAFTDGWFRTGDEGFFDQEGFLVIKGRLKEIINRGGEKISPREIDEVILDHPKVREVVTFSIPHKTLGEEIGVAIVLDGQDLTAREVQEHVAKRLATFKVPRHVSFMDEIPKGPTGKIQRIGLYERLGIEIDSSEDMEREYVQPETDTEKYLISLWQRTLSVDKIGVNDNYFQLGGDSLMAAEILSDICERKQIEEIPLVIFIYAPTVGKMAKILDDGKFELPPSSLIALQPKGSRPPIYCVHACEGDILFLNPLSVELGPDQPFYGIRSQGLDGKHSPITTVDEMAIHYLNEIRAFQPYGPYLLAGAGVGGIIALQMATVLRSKKIDVDKVFLFDMPKLYKNKKTTPSGTLIDHLLKRLSKGEIGPIFLWIKNRLRRFYHDQAERFVPRIRVLNVIGRAVWVHEPQPYEGEVILFISESHENPKYDLKSRISYWGNILKGKFDVHVIPGKHLDILKTPSVKILADILGKTLDDGT